MTIRIKEDELFYFIFNCSYYHLDNDRFNKMFDIIYTDSCYESVLDLCIDSIEYGMNKVNQFNSFQKYVYLWDLDDLVWYINPNFVEDDLTAFWAMFRMLDKYFGKESDEFKFFIETQIDIRMRRLSALYIRDKQSYCQLMTKLLQDEIYFLLENNMTTEELLRINHIINRGSFSTKLLKKILRIMLYRYDYFNYMPSSDNDYRSVLKPFIDKCFEEHDWKISKKKKFKRIHLSKGVRHEVFKRDNYTCQECGAKLGDIKPNGEKVKLEVDHIYPVSKGGTNDMNNLQTLCWECNRNKSDVIWQ